jgi:hypothetical protein
MIRVIRVPLKRSAVGSQRPVPRSLRRGIGGLSRGVYDEGSAVGQLAVGQKNLEQWNNRSDEIITNEP